MTTPVKINNINMFINKFDLLSIRDNKIIDLDILKQNFELGEGFERLSYSKRESAGTFSVTVNYNRPGVGPIETGLYCIQCSEEGPNSHSEDCPKPDDSSLNLTLEGFEKFIIRNPNPPAGFLELKKAFTTRTLTQTDLNDLLLEEDAINVVRGTVDIRSNRNVLTKIPYYRVIVKRGRKKLAPKTITTQFLNSIIIYYVVDGLRTSIRVSENGLINLINVPKTSRGLNVLKEALIRKIDESNSVDLEKFSFLTGSPTFKEIEDKTYIHSINAQFNVIDERSSVIDFENLNNLIAPGTTTSLSEMYTTRSGIDVIVLNRRIRIIEWSYVVGKISRSDTPTKDYIKFVAIPADGVKMTGIINKFGTIVVSLSRCNLEEICGTTFTPLDVDMINPIKETFQNIFREKSDRLIKKSFTPTGLKETDTISGYAGPCRASRTRDKKSGETYKEFVKPVPYSWKGKCPDPNYQYLDPIGEIGKDGLYYPCCSTITTKSVEFMKEYLRLGFPKGATPEIKRRFNLERVVEDDDPESGVIMKESRDFSRGDTARINIDGIWQTVTIIDKMSKKDNKYKIKVNQTVEIREITGTDFKKESRFFIGLEDLDKDSLLSCVKNYLNKLNLIIEEDGSIKFNVISELNETPSVEHREILLSLIGENQGNILPKDLTKYNIKELSTRHVLKYVPRDSYNFYLVLTPNKKFFINKYFNHLDSDIQETFKETIILNGYLKMGLPDDTEGDDTEVDSDGKYMYYITDLIYLADEGRRDGLKLDLSFTERETLLNSLRIKFAGISEVTFIYTPSFVNIKEDAMDIITETEDKNKLLFLDNTNISNSFILDDDDYDPDIIEVQIIEVDHNTYTVTFGYDDRSFESDPVFRGSKLDFIKFGFFEKTRIIFNQKDISVGDYVLLKINRDPEQKIVTNRKISIIEKTARTLSYDVVVNLLTKKFSPIKYNYFVSPSWMGLRLRS